MSRENLAIIQRMLATASDDPHALVAILDEDVVWEVGSLQILGGATTYFGPQGVMDFFRQWVGAFDGWDYEVGEIFATGDAVVAEIHQWGRGKASGVRVDQHFWQVWTLREGKAIRGTNHVTREEALASARSGAG